MLGVVSKACQHVHPRVHWQLETLSTGCWYQLFIDTSNVCGGGARKNKCSSIVKPHVPFVLTTPQRPREMSSNAFALHATTTLV